MSDSSIIEARLGALENRLSEVQAKLQKTESTQPFNIEAGKVFIEEAERPYHILEDIIAHTSSCLQADLELDRKQADGLGEAIAQHFSQHRHGLFGYIRSGTTQQKSDIKQGCLFDISTENVEQD